MSSSSEQPDRVPADVAARITARAAVLDTSHSEHVSLAEVRTAAIEAGISPDAFDTAVAEIQNETSATVHRPWWARVCLAGMVDRRAAMVAYWTWSIGLFAAPALMFILPLGVSRPIRIILATYFALACCFAAWGTARAIRWADALGWHKLP